MAIEAGAAYISLLPSLRGFSARVRRELKGLEIPVKLKPEVNRTEAAREGREALKAAQLAAPKLRIEPEVDRSALRQLGRGILSGLANVTGGASKLAGLGVAAGVAATALAGTVSAASALIPALVGLGAAAVTASGALVVVPGAAVLAATSVGLLRLGLVGLEDAFGALAKGDAAKFEEALKALTPNARAAVREIARLKPTFDKLRLSVQNRLFADTAARVRELARVHFPVLTAGAERFATVVNQRLSTALRSLATAQFRADFATILRSAAVAAGNLGTALVPALAAFRDLVTVGAQLSAELTGGLSAVLTSIAARISEMRASGQLEQMFRNGLAALGQFRDLAVDVAGVLRGLGAALGAGRNTGIFAFFDQLNALVNSAAGSNALQSLISELGQVAAATEPIFTALLAAIPPLAAGVSLIAKAFGPQVTVLVTSLGMALSRLAPGIAGLAPLIGAAAQSLVPLASIISGLLRGLMADGGLQNLLTDLAHGLAMIAPQALPVGRALGALLNAASPLIQVIGADLARGLATLAPAVEGLSNVLGPLVQLFAEAWTGAVAEILPPLMAQAQVALPMMAKAGLALYNAFQPLVPVIIEISRSVAGELTAALPQLTSTGEQLLAVIIPLSQQLGGQLLVFLRQLLPVLPGLVTAGLQLALAMAQLFIAVSPLIPPILRLATIGLPMLVGALYIVVGVMTLTSTWIRAIGSLVGWLIRQVGGLLSPLAGVGAAFQRFGSSASTATNSAVNTFRQLPARITSAIGNMGGLLYQAGRNVVQGLINGMASQLGALRNIASNLASTIRGFLPFSPAKEGPLSGRGNPLYSGQAIATLVAQGVQSRIPLVAASAEDLARVFAVQPAAGRLQAARIGASPALALAAASGDPGRVEALLLELLRAIQAGHVIEADGVQLARTVSRAQKSESRR